MVVAGKMTSTLVLYMNHRELMSQKKANIISYFIASGYEYELIYLFAITYISGEIRPRILCID